MQLWIQGANYAGGARNKLVFSDFSERQRTGNVEVPQQRNSRINVFLSMNSPHETNSI
jgi:hypothetical protein